MFGFACVSDPASPDARDGGEDGSEVTLDTGPTDSSRSDAGDVDAREDATPRDAGTLDVGMPDGSTVPDAGPDRMDAGMDVGRDAESDGGVEDAGSDASEDAGETVCGDGVLATSEACDDGNVVSGDGCGSMCNLSGVIDVPSDAISFRGDLTGAPTYVRRGSDFGPIEDSGCGASVGSIVARYRAHTIRNSGSARVRLRVRVAFDSDGYLHAFSTFDPTDSSMGCIAGNDDDGFSNRNSRVHPWVEAGGEITLVVSEYMLESATGPYVVIIDESP